MADGTLQILGFDTGPVPIERDISGSNPLTLLAVKADFDGSGAGVDWVPVVEIVSDAGIVMAQSKGDTVLAGGSATVTFFAEGGSGGGGPDEPGEIRFDVNNGQGEVHTLKIYANGANGFSFITDVATALTGLGFDFEAYGQANNGGYSFFADNGNFNVQVPNGINLQSTGAGVSPSINIGTNFGSGTDININADGSLFLSADDSHTHTHYIVLQNLPTANPGGSGRVWNNGGVLNIT